MNRVLFVEGTDEAILRAFAVRIGTPWRLLARPEQGLVLLVTTDPGEEVERAAATVSGVRSWAFEVVATGPGE